MRWFHPPLLADIQPGIGLWNVTTKYYKTMLFAWFVLVFFSTLYFKVLVILMVSVALHMQWCLTWFLFLFWKFKNQYLCDFYTKSLCKVNIVHFKLMWNGETKNFKSKLKSTYLGFFFFKKHVEWIVLNHLK